MTSKKGKDKHVIMTITLDEESKVTIQRFDNHNLQVILVQGVLQDDGTYKEVSSQKGYHRTVTGCLRAIADMFRESLSNDHFEQIDELIEREKMFQSVMEDFMKKHKSSLERLSDVD